MIVFTVALISVTWFRADAPITSEADLPMAVAGSSPNLRITLKDDNGRPVALSSFAGKVVVVNFFATWCAPCKVEIPDLVKLQALHAADVAVVGLQVFDDGGEPLTAFRTRLGITYPLLDANDSLDVERAFGTAPGLPTSFVLDRRGVIADSFVGATSFDAFEQAVQKALGK